MDYLSSLTSEELAFLDEQLGRPVTPLRRIVGGQSATTDVIRVGETELVLRRHGHWSIGFDDEIASREAAIMTAARAAGIPIPKVVWAGSLPTGTGIVTEAVTGVPVLRPKRPRRWAHQLAEMLVQVRSVPVDPTTAALLDAAPSQPAHLEVSRAFASRPRGDELLASREALRPAAPGRHLVHGDYWPGNLLWKGDAVTAVLDWEAAHLGDPIADLGYCYAEMHYLGMPEPARALVTAYEKFTDDDLGALRYWVIVALCRAVPSLESYLAGWRGVGLHADLNEVQLRLDGLIDRALDDRDL